MTGTITSITGSDVVRVFDNESGFVNKEVGITASNLASSLAALNEAANVPALSLNASGTYVEAEIQSIADKVDAILVALKAKNLMVAD